MAHLSQRSEKGINNSTQEMVQEYIALMLAINSCYFIMFTLLNQPLMKEKLKCSIKGFSTFPLPYMD